MIRIREVIIVEGRYDVNTVRQLVDTVVLETGGFRIFSDRERLHMFRRLASTRGLLILTDSDGAGLVIRNYLKSAIPREQLKHAYIPEIMGKERRKRVGSKAGTLGVEGMPPEVLRRALQRAGATILDEAEQGRDNTPSIRKADLFALGLSGQPGCEERRRAVLKELGLPSNLSANALLDYLNLVSNLDELQELVTKISNSP